MPPVQLRRSALVVAIGALACVRSPGEEVAEGAASRVAPAMEPRLVQQTSGTTALLQAVSPVNERIVWVSGHSGTWARTLDGGATWQTGRVPGADSLQFRDVHAASADSAWLMSAGTGPLSRIFRTIDGGRSWRELHVAREAEAFYDCMDFWDSRSGLVFSDAVAGRLLILATTDGDTWAPLPGERLPAALPGEGSFAASGGCLVTLGDRHAWVGMGNTTESRVLMTRDRGRTWRAVQTPVVAGEANGLTTVAFRDTLHGVALGGRIGAPDEFADAVATTRDGGQTWTLGGRPPFPGALYGGTYVPGAGPTIVAVGPNGMTWSRDDGGTWAPLDTLAYWSIGFAAPGAGWAVGPNGRIVRVELAR